MSVQSVSLERRGVGTYSFSNTITTTSNQVFSFDNILTVPGSQTLVGTSRLWNVVFSITIGTPVTLPAADITGYSVTILWFDSGGTRHYESQTIIFTSGERLIQEGNVINVAMTWIQTENCNQNITLEGCVLCPTGVYNVDYAVNGFYIN
jgi:hypothetical protein